MNQQHFPRPRPGADGRTPTHGGQVCRFCGKPIVRRGRRMNSDGVRGNWQHRERGVR